MKRRIQALENEVKGELEKMRPIDGPAHKPVTDGIVDIDRYCSISPRILWVLMEPHSEIPEGKIGEGWSLTQKIKEWIAKGQFTKRETLAIVAYVTYAIFNDYPDESDISFVTDDPKVYPSTEDPIDRATRGAS